MLSKPILLNNFKRSIAMNEKYLLNESTYLGSCVEVGDEDSGNYINDIFSDATEMAYYVGDPDSGDIGRSKEIKKPVFLKNISLSSIDKKTLKGDVQFYYIPDLKIYYIYTDDGIHHFYKS